jgi:hypothetical protein
MRSREIYGALSIHPSAQNKWEDIADAAIAAIIRIKDRMNYVRPILTNKGIDVETGIGEALLNGDVYKFVESGHATLEQLEKIYNEKPFVIDALRYGNVIAAVDDGRLKINELAKLSEQEVTTLIHDLPYDDIQTKAHAALAGKADDNDVSPSSPRLSF